VQVERPQTEVHEGRLQRSARVLYCESERSRTQARVELWSRRRPSRVSQKFPSTDLLRIQKRDWSVMPVSVSMP